MDEREEREKRLHVWVCVYESGLVPPKKILKFQLGPNLVLTTLQFQLDPKNFGIKIIGPFFKPFFHSLSPFTQSQPNIQGQN